MADSFQDLLASAAGGDRAAEMCLAGFANVPVAGSDPVPAAELRRTYALRLQHLHDRALVIAASPELLQQLDALGDGQAAVWMAQDAERSYIAFTNAERTRLAGCLVIPKTKAPAIGEASAGA